ncbi:hypothetical protein PVAP13_9NG420114 [Panicum virgatum]|uniref:Uncharacterized protein n=1 Tax=Panicum virgatum TaxID=38727 RepID=A0A8T0MQ87_PANVG|nr:hypothetical protein PVAP13_9NG420114 [Panicum virgatum]
MATQLTKSQQSRISHRPPLSGISTFGPRLSSSYVDGASATQPFGKPARSRALRTTPSPVVRFALICYCPMEQECRTATQTAVRCVT